MNFQNSLAGLMLFLVVACSPMQHATSACAAPRQWSKQDWAAIASAEKTLPANSPLTLVLQDYIRLGGY